MSLFPTRLQIKSAVADKLPFEGDIDSMIQEMQDRLYDAGVAPGSRREVDLDFSTARVTWNLLQVVQIDAGTYDGLVGVRDNEKPNSRMSWKVRDVEVEHQSPGGGANFFLDHGIHEVTTGVFKRIYQVPNILVDNDEVFKFLFKIQSPTISLDADEVFVKSVYVAKLGLMAIGYENEGAPRAPTAMQSFLANADQVQKRTDGVKHRYVGFSTGIRHKPSNRM